jgi:PST family polysaccharide transporter
MSVINNTKWLMISQIFKVGLQLISITFLTHLIEPSEYGLMAMATIAINFGSIIRDLGTSSALIQRKNLTQSIISTVFWLNILMGCVVGFTLAINAQFIAAAFKEPLLKNILVLLSITFPIVSSSAAHQAIQERNSKFKSVALIEITSSSIALVVAIISAYLKGGVYSLVYQAIVYSSLSTIGLWYTSTWRPAFVVCYSDLKQVFLFGGNLTLTNIVDYFSRNSDGIIIGHFFGALILGAYSIAYRIMLFPILNLTSIITRALFPILSQKQDDLKQIKKLYLNSVLFISSITAPLMFGVTILRNEFSLVAFGPKWDLVPSLILWLAPMGFLLSIKGSANSVLMAMNKTKLILNITIVSSIAQIAVFFIASLYDINVLVILYFLLTVVIVVAFLYITTKVISTSVREFFNIIKAPLISTTCMAAFLCLYLELVDDIGNIYFNLLMPVTIGALVYVVTYCVFFDNEITLRIKSKISSFVF